jgi:FkbM family methyltransferase
MHLGPACTSVQHATPGVAGRDTLDSRLRFQVFPRGLFVVGVLSQMRTGFNRAIGRFDFELVRVQPPREPGEPQRLTMDQVLDAAKSQGLNPASVVDVGVAYGTPDLYEAFPNASLLLIDPLREWEPVMQTLERDRGAHYVVAAAGAENGSITLNVPSELAWASTQQGPWESEPRVVPVVTVDSAVREAGLEPPYLLKVDVEGFELEVLRGAVDTLEHCDAVILETWLHATFSDLVSWMADHGFLVHDLYEFGYTDYGVLDKVDVLFARTGGPILGA